MLIAMLVTASLRYGYQDFPGAGLLAATLFAWLPLVVRTRWPLPVLVAVVVIESVHLVVLPGIDDVVHVGTNIGAYQPTPLATMIAAWTVASRLPRVTGWVAGLSAATVLLLVSLVAKPLELLATDMVMFNLVVIATGVGVLVATRRDRAERIERERDEDARQQVVAERLRIARDLHDVLAHHLTLVNAQAGVANYLLRTDPGKAATALSNISEHTGKALDELRATVGLLRQADDPERDAMEPVPGMDRLQDLIVQMRAAGAAIAVHVTGQARVLVPAADLAAYRIVQEALTNAAKHAHGAVVTVELRWSDRDLLLRVENGPGRSNGQSSGGHGLVGMRERARSCGGELTTHVRPDGGFVVSAVIPNLARMGPGAEVVGG
ncbi:sensor histidine kinase [Winogradskya humida]|uniref:sensor histidine kinase n=1 Tax=Winogradskya humida TaxID=113566 RepID=UPI0019448FE0|nr:sensor histidine kinase [Actinoplanes humidus]